MDDRRFDEMTRALAGGASRRRVLAGLAAGAIAALSGGRVRAQENAAACAAILCETNTKCCEVDGQGTCVPLDQPCPPGSGGGEPCGTAVCGAGEFCCNFSCSICAPLGGACTQQACNDAGEPPAPAGEPCNAVTCGVDEFCCNESCSICAPIGGFCTAQFCGDEPEPPAGEPCNGVTCGAGEFCCNESCSICAPLGGACTEQFCGEGEPCGDAVCGAGEFCCNPSCGICAPLGGACTQQACDDGPICAPAGDTCFGVIGGCCEGLVCTSTDPATGVCAQPPATCRGDADCAAGITDPCTGATCDGGTCLVTSVLCAPGFVCCGNGTCCAAECTTAADCPKTDNCNSVACAEGRCVSTLIACDCSAAGEPCGDDANCCEGLICGKKNVCRPKGPTPTPIPPKPTPPTPVPPKPVAPKPVAPKPVAPIPNVPAPKSVTASPPRPATTSTVSRLPNTGTAAGGERAKGRWAAPLALAAAAAAAFAGRLGGGEGEPDRS